MRCVQLKKWLTVWIPLFLLSLGFVFVYHAFHGLSDKLTIQGWRDFHRQKEESQRQQNSVYKWDDSHREKEDTQGQQNSVYKWHDMKSKRSNRITLAVVEEHHEGKQRRRGKVITRETCFLRLNDALPKVFMMAVSQLSTVVGSRPSIRNNNNTFMLNYTDG